MQKKNASALSMPEYKGDVYIQGPAFYASTARTFRENGYRVVSDMSAADIIILTGGEDINPKMYGERPLGGTYFSPKRDTVDMYAAQTGISAGKFMVGICRGAQLLNCWPNGGKLWQDVDQHNGLHDITDTITKKVLRCNSVHHQMMKLDPEGNGVLVAYATVSNFRRSEGITDTGFHKDPEVVWYPDTKCLLFQGHPEFGHPGTTEYFFELMDRYFLGRKPNDIGQEGSISHDTKHDEKDEQSDEEDTPLALLSDCGNETGTYCTI